jgi:hypothetical protein
MKQGTKIKMKDESSLLNYFFVADEVVLTEQPTTASNLARAHLQHALG